MRINDSSKFPDDFWNYYVNPILGYHYSSDLSKKHERQ